MDYNHKNGQTPLVQSSWDLAALQGQTDQHQGSAQPPPFQGSNTDAPALSSEDFKCFYHTSCSSPARKDERVPLLSPHSLCPYFCTSGKPLWDPPRRFPDGARCRQALLRTHSYGTVQTSFFPFACHEKTQPTTKWGGRVAQNNFISFHKSKNYKGHFFPQAEIIR